MAHFVMNIDLVPHGAEEFQQIERPLMANAFALEAMPVERGNLIMVTGAVPREGKTFTPIMFEDIGVRITQSLINMG